MPAVEIVLVHGSWHGSWCWELLRPELDKLGRVTHVVDLPSMTGAQYGVEADAKVVREKVDSIDGPVLLVGHSYGGEVVSQASVRAGNIARLVYLAAFQIDDGQSPLALSGRELPADLEFVPPFDNPIDTFYADVPADVARDAVARLRPQSAQAARDRQIGAGWRDIPSTYIVCEQDKAVPPAVQEEMARQADDVRRLDASHSPFLSMPSELAALLADIASAVDNS
ncbi:alpha/beta fold hydrolase [Kutzneria sp. CA-103260]|uniref:alpha/beta fold hydrolase n=1 Tax=Kutzneria sp. CA-103260 TaxID=2802641 RepID=UPI001BAD0412|nr:alpha/beta fold hydrolase [Kutzneria sp. CA-103260]QUQ72299.1 alpha/beta hydrolase [Kutzneria sp. CA-103260]